MAFFINYWQKIREHERRYDRMMAVVSIYAGVSSMRMVIILTFKTTKGKESSWIYL